MPVISKIKIKTASISSENLSKLLESLAKDRILLAPVRDRDLGDVNFLPVSDPVEICLDYSNTTTSPKEFFFPQAECMFSFSGSSNDSIKAVSPDEEIVLFGVRSCDLMGLELLDRFYSRDFEDNFYISKRKKSVIISMTCCELNDQCFCTSVGTGPFLTEGFDIQLIDTKGGYAVQVGSEKGLELYKKYENYFAPATDSDINAVLKHVKSHEKKFDLQKVHDNLRQEKNDERLWEDIGDRCQSCGLCLFLCPTCSCYTVTDKTTPLGQSRRDRQWDACYFRGFTRMSGGHDPVRNRAQMARRKYKHKLLQQIDEFAMSGCVGCGRCNLTCVGNVNWLENIIKIEKGSLSV